MFRYSILIVDDDPTSISLLKEQFEKDYFIVQTAVSGDEAFSLLEKSTPSLIILDLVMPEMDGWEICRRIRKNQDTPILMLSDRHEESELIVSLELGADDYVTKPFNPLEVMARVKSLLRRSQHDVKNDEPDQIEIGPLIIKKDSHEVETVTGKSIQLTALEFGILYLLASHPNRVFSADEIFERVWQQESVVSAKTVMVHVSHLRDKIEESTGGEKVIQTVWGVGYKIESH